MAGLTISVPLIIAGAAIIMALLARLPTLVWAIAALLGWVAGEMLDPSIVGLVGDAVVHGAELPVAAVCAALVIGLGYILRRRSAEQDA